MSLKKEKAFCFDRLNSRVLNNFKYQGFQAIVCEGLI